MSKTGIRMGHMKDVDQGAVGIVKEFDVNRAYTPYVMAALIRSGEDIVDCTPQTAIDTANSLCQGVDAANNANADIFVSCHVNAYYESAHGVEVLYYPGSEVGKTLAIRIVQEIESLGFYNRGVRPDDRGLYELKATNMPAVIVEPFFCTNKGDVELYNKVGPKALGEAIAKGILNYKGKQFIPESEVPESQVPYVVDLCGQGINMQMFSDHLEVRIGNGPWQIVKFD